MNLTADTSLALIQSAQGQASSAIDSAKQAAKNKEMERLDVVSKDFEAMFVTEMMRPMFSQLKPDPIFGGGKGEEIFQGMMLQEYGKMMAETGQIGIADSVKEALIRMQGGELELELETEEVKTSETDNKNTRNLDHIIEEMSHE